MHENGDYGVDDPGYDWNRRQPGGFYGAPWTSGGGSAWGGKKPARRKRSLGVAAFWVAASALLVNVIALLLFKEGLRDLWSLADSGMAPEDGDLAKLFLLLILMLVAGIWGVVGLSLGIAGLVFSSKDGDARNRAYSILAIVFTFFNPLAISMVLNQFGLSLL